jgi:ABC-type transport system involved in cytochrome c biogenesis permease subunit
VNSLLLWFNQTGSPPNFDRFCARWAPWAWAIAFARLAIGVYGALFAVPADAKQGENFRILYLHVPAAWMSLFIYGVMAIQAFIALVWRIKACEILAMACAPVGAAFTLITLATGSIWGRPTWGTWWEWDPRLTSELVLLFIYFGVMGLYCRHRGSPRRRARRRLPRADRHGQRADRALRGELVEHAAPGRDDQAGRALDDRPEHAVAARRHGGRHQGLVRRARCCSAPAR